MEIILTSCTGEWTEITGFFNNFSGWKNAGSSSDGRYQYISTDQNIFYSFDSGVLWNKLPQNFSGIKPNSLAVSSGGSIVGIIDHKNIQISFNYGNSWVNDLIPNGNFKNWKKLAFSSDAKYMTALGFGTEIYKTSNFGVTWSTGSGTVAPQNWISVSLSDDGRVQLAAVKSGSLWRSFNYGEDWDNILDLVPRTFFISGAKEILKGSPVLYPGDTSETYFLISGGIFYETAANVYQPMSLSVTGSYKLYNLNSDFNYYECFNNDNNDGVEFAYVDFILFENPPSFFDSNPIQGLITGENSELKIKIQSSVNFPENTFYLLEIENLVSNNPLFTYNSSLNTYDWFNNNNLIKNNNYYLITNC
jgi:hypothetical protein